MTVLIIEDERPAAERLARQLIKLRPDTEVVATLDSVRGTLNWLYRLETDIDLVFLDIELADGQSFEIFRHASFPAPVVFTTAYDAYAIEAFKLDTLDYLLKPIEAEALDRAISKWEDRHKSSVDQWQGRMDRFMEKLDVERRSRCLVKKGSEYHMIPVEDLFLVYSEDSVTFLITRDGQRHIYNRSIEQMEKELDPRRHFRIGRSQIVSLENIHRVHSHLGQRLKLELKESGNVEEVFVSRQRVPGFKQWLDS